MNMPIAFVDLKGQYHDIQSEIDTAIKSVLERGIFIGGEEVTEFEKEFASLVESKHCIGLNSGTDALILGMRALGLKPGDEVILPTNTFIATALGATENGLKPVFADIDERDNGMNLDDLRRKITSRTRAVIAVHLYGQADKMDLIQEVIKKSKKNIVFIEDAAQTHGGTYNGKPVGTTGVFSIFSFYPGKNLGAYGDAGAIATQDDRLADTCRLLREYGSRKKYYHETLGRNSRLDTIQAAILRVKLKYLKTWNNKRQNLAKLYSSKLAGLQPQVITPNDFPERPSIYHVYMIRAKRRDQLQQYLKDHGIISLIHYPVPLHLQPAFQYMGHAEGDFPVAERLAGEILSLPMYPELPESDMDTVVARIKEFYQLTP